MSDFKARASELLKRLAETGAPIVITQHGRAAGVLSPSEFDAPTERIPFVNVVAKVLEDAGSGNVVPHESMVAEVQTRYGDQE